MYYRRIVFADGRVRTSFLVSLWYPIILFSMLPLIRIIGVVRARRAKGSADTSLESNVAGSAADSVSTFDGKTAAERPSPEDVLRDHLESEEELLWHGQPVQGITFRASDALMIPFSVLWCGFAIASEAMALGFLFAASTFDEGPSLVFAIIFALFGLPFVLIGLYMVFGRFLVEARQRSRTFYGVTAHRIIIVAGLFSRKVKSLNLRTVSDLSMSQKTDGSGTITFGPTHPLFAFFGGTSWPSSEGAASLCFDRVADVAEAYRIIRDAQKDL